MYRQIEKTLPLNIFNSFFCRQETNFNRIWRKEQERINKIKNLRASHRFRERMKIKNINYNIMHSLDSEMNCDTLIAPLKLKKISTKDITAYERQTILIFAQTDLKQILQ